jgi:hypothetical protein
MAELPEQIFKYVSSDRIDILEKLRIRFTQPSYFNDPFEMRVSVEGHSPESLDKAEEEVYKNQFLKYALRGGEHSYEKFRKIQKSYNRTVMGKLKFDPHYQKQAATAYAFKKWDSQVGILSLSAIEKNLLMWAHYADSHRGMLIEFNPKHTFFNGPNPSDAEFNFGMLTKVVYSKDRPKNHVEKTSVLEIIPMLKTKSDEWIKEKEWRVYEMLEKRTEQVTKGSETVYLFKLPPDCIKRVVVGYNMDYKNRKRVVDAVKTNPKLKGIKIEESVLNLDLFSLEYQPLPDLY